MNIYVSAYLDKNLGDDLMIRLLAHSFPELRFHLFCPDPDLFPALTSHKNLFPTSVPVKMLGSRARDQFDAYIRIGGSIFGMRGRRTPFYRYISALQMGCMTRKGFKSAMIGCNVNTFSSAMARRTAKKELSAIGLVTVRDEPSFQFAKPLRPENSLFLYPDMLFSIPDDFLPKQGEKHGHLGVSVYRSKYLTEENRTYCRALAEFSDRYIEQTGKEVHFLAFDAGRENDLLAAREIMEQMKHRDHCKVLGHQGDGSHLLGAITQCGVIVGTRFHAIVLAMRLGIPFVPITYSEKTVNLLRDINYRGVQFDFTSMDDQTPAALLRAVITLDYSVGADIDQLIDLAGGHMQKLREYLES